MNFLTYLCHLLQYAFWNPSNPVWRSIAWGALVWGLLIWAVPHIKKLHPPQWLLKPLKINDWRFLILVVLILSSVIVAAYNYASRQSHIRPIVILSQNGIAGDNTTVTINFYIENIGVNTAYNIYPIVCWAPESKPQDLSYPGMSVSVWYLDSGEQDMLPLKLDRNDFLGNFLGNDSDRWYIYYSLEYSDAPSKGTEYTEQYSYLFDFSTRSLSELSRAPAFQPYTSSK
jgi:hypothetical protein